jgi:hypothetical protein
MLKTCTTNMLKYFKDKWAEQVIGELSVEHWKLRKGANGNPGQRNSL